MKVLIIHTVYKQKGGEDTVVANEIELLKSAEINVDLLIFSNKNNTLLKTLTLPFNYSSYLETKKRILSFRPDVIHIHNLHFAGSPSLIFAIRRFRIPIVLTLHNYRLLCPSATLFYNGKIFTDSVKKRFSWKAVLKGVYLNSKILTFWVNCSVWLHQQIGTWNYVNKYIALGEHTRQIFFNSKLNSITPKIVIKPNFCYRQSVFNSENKNVGSYYLYVGRLSTEKGVETLLKAFSKNKLPLKIAGNGPLAALVKEFSEENTNINFLGTLNKEDVANELSDASALIFPSEWYETFGMVVIEAFSSGIPVIASSLGQLKFTIKHQINGLHFEPGNPESLVAAVNFYELLPLEEKLKYRQEAYKCYQQFYSPEVNKRQILTIYNDILNR